MSLEELEEETAGFVERAQELLRRARDVGSEDVVGESGRWEVGESTFRGDVGRERSGGGERMEGTFGRSARGGLGVTQDPSIPGPIYHPTVGSLSTHRRVRGAVTLHPPSTPHSTHSLQPHQTPDPSPPHPATTLTASSVLSTPIPGGVIGSAPRFRGTSGEATSESAETPTTPPQHSTSASSSFSPRVDGSVTMRSTARRFEERESGVSGEMLGVEALERAERGLGRRSGHVPTFRPPSSSTSHSSRPHHTTHLTPLSPSLHFTTPSAPSYSIGPLPNRATQTPTQSQTQPPTPTTQSSSPPSSPSSSLPQSGEEWREWVRREVEERVRNGGVGRRRRRMGEERDGEEGDGERGGCGDVEGIDRGLRMTRGRRVIGGVWGRGERSGGRRGRGRRGVEEVEEEEEGVWNDAMSESIESSVETITLEDAQRDHEWQQRYGCGDGRSGATTPLSSISQVVGLRPYVLQRVRREGSGDGGEGDGGEEEVVVVDDDDDDDDGSVEMGEDELGGDLRTDIATMGLSEADRRWLLRYGEGEGEGKEGEEGEREEEGGWGVEVVEERHQVEDEEEAMGVWRRRRSSSVEGRMEGVGEEERRRRREERRLRRKKRGARKGGKARSGFRGVGEVSSLSSHFYRRVMGNVRYVVPSPPSTRLRRHRERKKLEERRNGLSAILHPPPPTTSSPHISTSLGRTAARFPPPTSSSSSASSSVEVRRMKGKARRERGRRERRRGERRRDEVLEMVEKVLEGEDVDVEGVEETVEETGESGRWRRVVGFVEIGKKTGREERKKSGEEEREEGEDLRRRRSGESVGAFVERVIRQVEEEGSDGDEGSVGGSGGRSSSLPPPIVGHASWSKGVGRDIVKVIKKKPSTTPSSQPSSSPSLHLTHTPFTSPPPISPHSQLRGPGSGFEGMVRGWEATRGKQVREIEIGGRVGREDAMGVRGERPESAVGDGGEGDGEEEAREGDVLVLDAFGYRPDAPTAPSFSIRERIDTDQLETDSSSHAPPLTSPSKLDVLRRLPKPSGRMPTRWDKEDHEDKLKLDSQDDEDIIALLHTITHPTTATTSSMPTYIRALLGEDEVRGKRRESLYHSLLPPQSTSSTSFSSPNPRAYTIPKASSTPSPPHHPSSTISPSTPSPPPPSSYSHAVQAGKKAEERREWERKVEKGGERVGGGRGSGKRRRRRKKEKVVGVGEKYRRVFGRGDVRRGEVGLLAILEEEGL